MTSKPMEGNNLSSDYWNDRYAVGSDGWDIGQVSPPLKAYFDQLEDKSLKILIPGCGRGYEAIYLWKLGFKRVHCLDFAEAPLTFINEHLPEFPSSQLIQEDFFELKGGFDLIVEQTMFCAINPSMRQRYADQAADLLKPNGKLVGLLFNRTFEGGPPFGGNEQEYRNYFEPLFREVKIAECYNSLTPRQGTELFVKMTH